MCRSYGLDVFPVELVRTIHSSLVPIGPVDPVFEGGDGERMAEDVSGVQDHAAGRSVVVTR